MRVDVTLIEKYGISFYCIEKVVAQNVLLFSIVIIIGLDRRSNRGPVGWTVLFLQKFEMHSELGSIGLN